MQALNQETTKREIYGRSVRRLLLRFDTLCALLPEGDIRLSEAMSEPTAATVQDKPSKKLERLVGQGENLEGYIELKGTLILAPNLPVNQWVQEIEEE